MTLTPRGLVNSEIIGVSTVLWRMTRHSYRHSAVLTHTYIREQVGFKTKTSARRPASANVLRINQRPHASV